MGVCVESAFALPYTNKCGCTTNRGVASIFGRTPVQHRLWMSVLHLPLYLRALVSNLVIEI